MDNPGNLAITEEMARAMEDLNNLKDSDSEAYESAVTDLGDEAEADSSSGADVTFTEAQQDAINQMIANRIARERERWEKDNPLRGDLEQTTEELEQLRNASSEARARAFETAREREFDHVLETMRVEPNRRKVLRDIINLGEVAATDEHGLVPDRRALRK